MLRRVGFLVCLAVTALGCAGDSALDDAAEAAQARPAQTRRAPQPAPVAGYRGPLPPIPSSVNAGAPPDVVRAVYEFAARRPDVLRYVPCFCGCERNGHQDNEDCFVASRAADGRPEWDRHGLT